MVGFCFCFLKAGFLCVIFPILELSLSVDQAGLELNIFLWLCFPKAGIKGLCRHLWALVPTFL